MEKKHFLQSNAFRGILIGGGVATAVLVIFSAGIAVGTRRAFFACKWGENYGRNFGGAMGMVQMRMAPAPFGGRMPGPHGALGIIISTTDDGIVVKGTDDVERSVLVTDGSEIHRGKDRLGQADLVSGMQVMTFGEPNDQGQIEAAFIRVLSKDLLP